MSHRRKKTREEWLNDKQNLVDKISRSQLLYLVSLLLQLDKPKESELSSELTLAHLVMVMDEDQLIKLINLLEGSTIRIPTKEEFNKYLLSALVYMYVKLGLDYKEIKALLPTDRQCHINDIKRMYNSVAELMKDRKIPKIILDKLDRSSR